MTYINLILVFSHILVGKDRMKDTFSFLVAVGESACNRRFF